MEKIYYSASTRGFYFQSIHGGSVPQDAVEIAADQYKYLLEGESSGKEISVAQDGSLVLVDPVIDSAELATTERLWRDEELKRADIELYKVQDSDPKSKGSVAQWREYRKALRALPENPLFPNKEARPTAPDS